MATYVKSSSFGDFKAYYTYETSQSNTAYTIKVTNAGLYQSCSYSQYPWKTVLSATDYSSTTATKGSTYWTKGYHALITSDKSYTYKRKTSPYTVTIKAKTSKNISGGGYGTASKTFTIPALPSYTISYNANGGSGAPSSQTKYYGTNLTLSSTKPTRTGYTFLGWSTSSTATTATWKAGGTYSINAADTLYAVWKANTYTISYNANGGSGAPSGQTKTYGVNLTLSSTKPTREYYKFVGWNTNANGTGTSYSAGGTYSTNSAVTLYAIWEEDYTPPSISQPVAYRTNGSAMADDGKYAVVSFMYTKGRKSGQDVTPTSLVVQYRENGTTAWSTAQTITSYTGSVTTNHFGGNALSPDKQYDVQVVLSDAYGSVTATTFISKSSFAIDVNAAGDVVSIGEAASDSESDLFSVAWASRFKKAVEFKEGVTVDGDLEVGGNLGLDNAKYITMKDTNAVAHNIVCLNSNNNLIIGYGMINDGSSIGDTYIYGKNIRLLPEVTTTSFRPYYQAGDSFYVYIYTAGFVSSSSKNIYFLVPFSKPVIGNPTITAKSQSDYGFILRQDGKYTHGSSSSTYVKPSSYTVTVSNIGIRVYAVFSTTTNAVNNAPVGITWGGTITFS